MRTLLRGASTSTYACAPKEVLADWRPGATARKGPGSAGLVFGQRDARERKQASEKKFSSNSTHKLHTITFTLQEHRPERVLRMPPFRNSSRRGRSSSAIRADAEPPRPAALLRPSQNARHEGA